MRLLLCLSLAFAAALSQAVIVNVRIQNFAFSSDDITINSGDSVKWTNLDFAPHTASSTSGPESFNSGTLTNGQTFTKLFTAPGMYMYRCNIHTHMMGMINVVPEPSGIFAMAGASLLILRRKK